MSIAQRIHALLEQDPSAHPSTLATQLAVSEWEVVRHLPAELMTLAVNPTEWHLPVHHLLSKPAKFVFVDPIGSH